MNRAGWLAIGMLVAIGLSSCGGGSDVSTTPTVDISGLEEDAPRTTASTTTITADPAGDREESAAPTSTAPATSAARSQSCQAIADVLLVAPRLEVEAAERPTDDAVVAAWKATAASAPADEQAAWEQLVGEMEKGMADPSYRPADVDALLATWERGQAWARDLCPDLPPAWACMTQAKFAQIPMGDPNVDPAPLATPAAVVANGDRSEVLLEDDEAVLYGALDDDGFVTSTSEVVKGDGGWTLGTTRSCR